MRAGFPHLAALLCAVSLALAPVVSKGEPPSVFMEELTWVELRDAIEEGYTTVILPTGGTEQNGPHMVLGKHNVIVEHAAAEIARRLGNALVAPVVAYTPQGPLDPPTGHMLFPGTITLPDAVFTELVVHAARSFRVHGFEDIVLIADSGGNVAGLEEASRRLRAQWRGSPVRVHFASEYMRGEEFRKWLLSRGETRAAIGRHAGIMDTSVALAVDPALVRTNEMSADHQFLTTGVVGDPSRANVVYGRKGLEIQIDNAVTQIRRLIAVHDN